MNPLTNIKNVQKLNERELELGITGKKSWHDEYKDSAWLFIGGMPYDLSEGDIICVFSQYGEVVNFNLVRDRKTGKPKGFSFLCYEDQRSTVLAVDNLNGIKILGRTIRVDHVQEYKIPKEHKDEDEYMSKLREHGCAPTLESSSDEEEEEDWDDMIIDSKNLKKETKPKKKKKKKKKSKKATSSSSCSDSESDNTNKRTKDEVEIKQEKHDAGYDKSVNFSHHRKNSDKSRDYKKERDVSKVKLVHRHSERNSENSGRDRSRSRERKKARSKSPNRQRDRSKDRRDRSRSREKERSRNRDRSREREKSRDRHRSRERHRYEERERSREKDVYKYRDRSRDRRRDR